MPARPAQLRLAAAAAALTALWLAMLLARRPARSTAGSTRRSTPAAVPRWSTTARIFTALGEPTVLVGAGFARRRVAVVGRKRGTLALALLLVILVGRGLSEVQKYWIARARPDARAASGRREDLVLPERPCDELDDLLPDARARAHAGYALAAARRRAARSLLSLLIGISRVMLGVHWPSDVIGGWAFGLLWVLLTLRLAERLVPRRFRLSADHAMTLGAKGEGRYDPQQAVHADRRDPVRARWLSLHLYRLFTHFQIILGSHTHSATG